MNGKLTTLFCGILLSSILLLGSCASQSEPQGFPPPEGYASWEQYYEEYDQGQQQISTEPVPTPTPTLGYSRSNPAPIGTTLSIQFKLIAETYIAEITVVEIIRGREAWNLISDANMFNDAPSSGYEYVLAKIRFHYLSSSPTADREFDWYYFEAVSSQGQIFDEPFLVEPDPKLTAVYPGATTEGWEVLLVRVDDPAPLLTFGTDSGGTTSRVWFKLYE